uniref:AlNc14C191G8441 protein n=1 Tax=Albugo laibachii Nc14 TaxID=890382 RepID=F0WPV0_9STRA|nr:AlNc14C191G8441 [Albugo laibachii Nc14]|eukprot:CCA23351.1 AlNc14C191G8441 [Albugo laibachii Nc14]
MSLVAKQIDWLSQLLGGGIGEELIRNECTTITSIIRSFQAGSKYFTCNNYGVTPGLKFSHSDAKKYCKLAVQLVEKVRARFYSLDP